ncbi:MAG: endonuclease/exonuclease/phosphatase family protein [bacterium]|nr:endonuclease/exonuclease/phosphatase family protein [bacterium]
MENKTIKLISLNTWAGRSMYLLMKFFQCYADKVDIFCLQEMYDTDQNIVDEKHPEEHVCGKLFPKVSNELKDFEGSFAYFDDDPNRMSLAIFVRRGLPIKTIEDFVVYKPEKPQETGSSIISPRKLQYLTLEKDGKEFMIANFHGLWIPAPKTDTPERIAQSQVLNDFLDKFNCSKVLCGDFNLLPDTQSVKMIEKNMRNLVTENNIQSTRTILYRNIYQPDEPKFADYIFTSPDVKVVDFKVLPDICSDHSPLYLEFGI